MTDDLSGLEDTVRRLREIRAAAEDADRPRAALLLGLAISDLVPQLPAGDPRRRTLTSEGLDCLDESQETSDTGTRARERLTIAASQDAEAAETEPPEPETIRIGQADMNWDIDWEALQGPSEAARNLMEAMPFIGSMLPPGTPLAQMINSFTEVMRAFDSGEWSARHDEALATATAAARQLEGSGGLASSLGLMLRVMAMTIRLQRCAQTGSSGAGPGWPSLAEYDDLISALESDGGLEASLGAPFQAMDGFHHMYIASMIMARLNEDIRQGGIRMDSAWRGETLQLIDKANDHLRQTPAAYARQVQELRGQLARCYAVISQPGAPASKREPAARPATKPPSPKRRTPTGPPRTTSAPTARPAPATASATPPVPSPSEPVSGPSVSQVSLGVLEGLKVFAGQVEGPMSEGLRAMTIMTGTLTSGRWLPEHDEQLARLREEAERLGLQEETALESAYYRFAAAVCRGIRANFMSGSPRPGERPGADELAETVSDLESVLEDLSRSEHDRPGSMAMLGEVPSIAHQMASMLLVDLARLGAEPRDELLARARRHHAEVQAGVLDQFPVFRDLEVFADLFEGRIGLDDEAVRAVAGKNPNLWEQGGGDLQLALDAAARAERSGEQSDTAAAIMKLQMVWTGLPAGSPHQARVLIALASMMRLLARITSTPVMAIDALGIAIEAVRAAVVPAEIRGAAHALMATLTQMAVLKQYRGPFREAETVLSATLANAAPEDWALRVTLTAGVGAATGMQGSGQEDGALLSRSRETIADAVRILPGEMATGLWYSTAKGLCGWAVLRAVYGPDSALAPLALDIIDRLERVLGTRPELIEQLYGPAADPAVPAHAKEAEALSQARQLLLSGDSGDHGETTTSPPDNAQEHGEGSSQPRPEEARALASRLLRAASEVLGFRTSGALSRRPLSADGRPAPESLRSLSAGLHEAMATVDDIRLRHQIDEVLGLCHAELYWADPAERNEETLREAVVHLNRSLMTADHGLPAIEWADLLGVLARCYRAASVRDDRDDDEQARDAAERTARASLREFARCVLVAGQPRDALAVANRANDILTQAIGWCLDNGRYQSAIDIAETGRGLVLASIVIAGRVDETLRAAGETAAAAAWGSGTEAERATALNTLWETAGGDRMLTAPAKQETALAMIGTRFDALVYLVPPAEPEASDPDSAGSAARAGHALLVRPVLGEVEILPLPGLTAGEMAPLTNYAAAFDAALTAFGSGADQPDGFRGSPLGREWADALEELGRWTYQRITGPLIRHAGGWDLSRPPHLALIPLGVLGTIPYAASWTEDEETGTRRYAIEDLVISYGATARLLTEVSRRPRQALSERVVLVSDPMGHFPMTRRATNAISRRQYRDAELYGLKSAPNGAATTAALLSALPGSDRPGASLFQLSTHATAKPDPRLQAKDGWLPLARVLDQARNRPPDAPGGLVITNACLTDSAHDVFDESLTLATAFLAAGATSVIGTRWPVDDDTTALLSLRIHYHLHSGRPPAEALRNAQLDLLRPREEMRATLDPHLAAIDDSRLSHPASWAGHVHHGI